MNQTIDNGRVRNPILKEKLMSAEEASKYIHDGMVVGVSGFTPSGYPKAVPLALAERVKAEGKPLKVTLYSGASLGPEIDGAWTEAGIIARRLPYQTNAKLRDAINSGEVQYIDMHLSHSPQYIRQGMLPKPNIAIIEAVAITEEGHIIPSAGIGNTPVLVEMADQVIVEINTNKPMALEGMADIYMPSPPPNREPIPLCSPAQRIGVPYVTCGLEKIIAVVTTDLQDKTRPLTEVDDASKRISENILKFLRKEVAEGKLPQKLLPIQSGVGSVANAVLAGLCEAEFEGLSCYTEVVQDSMLDLLRCGKATIASTTSVSPSPEGLKRFEEEIEFFKDKIILRPQEVSNNPEVIRRLGVISINTAIEADIYGNVNSTHIMGTKMMNGIGGSGDFARNGAITIFTTESIAKHGDISSIVPMVSHVDHTEHDVMVLVTEQGYADLRGLSPKEKALQIIDHCVHPDYREKLRDYFQRACEQSYHQTPHLLEEALSWHTKFLREKTMR